MVASQEATPLDQVQLRASHSGPPSSALAQQGLVTGAAVAGSMVTGFVQGYLTPSEIYQRCQEMARKFPDLVEMVERDYKTHGYDGKNAEVQGPASLYYLRLGPKNVDRDKKLGVFQFAAPHAREWVNPMIMMELAEQLVQNYDPGSQDPAVRANTELLQKLDILIAPMTNPDGTNFSMFDDKMWRKSRVPTVDGNFGVDINRNYPTGWTPGDAAQITYPGTSPLSEPETRSIVGVVDEHPNVRFVTDWHSYAEEIRRPEGVSQADQEVYQQLQDSMGQAIHSVRGREYDKLVSEVVDGTSDDYFYQARKTYSMVVETGRTFQPKPEEALQVMREGVAGARAVLHFARDYQDRKGSEPAHP